MFSVSGILVSYIFWNVGDAEYSSGRYVVIPVVFLGFYKLPEGFAAPRMVHGWYFSFLWNRLFIIIIEIPGFFLMLRNGFQSIDIFVIYITVEASIVSLNYHYLGAFAIVSLHSVTVHHTVVLFIELDTVTTVHSALCKNRQREINFFI